MKKITSKDHKVNALLQTDIQQLRKCPDIVSHVWLLDLILSSATGAVNLQGLYLIIFVLRILKIERVKAGKIKQIDKKYIKKKCLKLSSALSSFFSP